MGILTTEQIDNIIKEEIRRMSPNSGIRKVKIGSWREEPLFLRRQEIMKLYGKGMTKISIMNEIMNRWGCKKTTAFKYVEDAIDFIVESYKEDMDKLKNIIMNRLEYLAEDAMDNRDRKSALKAYDQLSKLAGLYEEKVKTENNTVISFDFGGDN